MHVVVLLKGWSIIILWGEIEVGKKCHFLILFFSEEMMMLKLGECTYVQQHCFLDTACLCCIPHFLGYLAAMYCAALF